MSSAVTSSKGEVVRIVFPSSLKSQFRHRCEDHGQTMSERVRQLVVQDLAQEATPADKLAAILDSAERKNTRSGLPEPSIDDIDDFIAQVRAERIEAGLIR